MKPAWHRLATGASGERQMRDFMSEHRLNRIVRIGQDTSGKDDNLVGLEGETDDPLGHAARSGIGLLDRRDHNPWRQGEPPARSRSAPESIEIGHSDS